MSETNTTTLEPTTTIKVRKTRTRKQSPERINALKAAVSKALKQEWVLQQHEARLAKTLERGAARAQALSNEARAAWSSVQSCALECANARIV